MKADCSNGKYELDGNFAAKIKGKENTSCDSKPVHQLNSALYIIVCSLFEWNHLRRRSDRCEDVLLQSK